MRQWTRLATRSSERGVANRRRLLTEIGLVLGLSLAQSAVYAVVSLVAKLTQGPLRTSTATLNASQSPRPYLDLTYQLLHMGFALMPVGLALFLLDDGPAPVRERLGLTFRWRDWAWGVVLAAGIGLPGLALYYGGRALGVTAEVIPAALNDHWWSVPVLVLSAIQNAVLEEVIVVAYLITRLERLPWRVGTIVAVSAVLRGSYHLYQGFGPFVGNAVMGVVFALFFLRYRRVMPLVIAHTLLDVVAFVGYWLFLR